MTPELLMTWPASVRCTVWLGRIYNDLRRPKNKCRNLHFAGDTTAYVMQSLRMKTNKTWSLVARKTNQGGETIGFKTVMSIICDSERTAKARFHKILGVRFSGKCSSYHVTSN